MRIHGWDFEGAGQGQFWLRIERSDISPVSKVCASICERPQGSLRPQTGFARMSVHNVVAHEEHVHLWVEIEWDSALLYMINLIVVNA